MKTMPFCSALAARGLELLLVHELGGLIIGEEPQGLGIFTRRGLVRAPPRFWNIDCMLLHLPCPAGHDLDAGGKRAQLDFDLAFIEFAAQQALSEFLAGLGSRGWTAIGGKSREFGLGTAYRARVPARRRAAGSRTRATSCSRVILTATSASS